MHVTTGYERTCYSWMHYVQLTKGSLACPMFRVRAAMPTPLHRLSLAGSKFCVRKAATSMDFRDMKKRSRNDAPSVSMP